MNKTITSMLMMILMITGTSFSQDKQDWKYVHPTPQNNIQKKVNMISETEWVVNGGNGSFMHTSNSGINWYSQFFAGKVNASTLATDGTTDSWFFDSNTGIVVGGSGYIGRTVNGGVTFDTAGTGLSPANSRNNSIWFANANTGFIGAGAQGAFTTRIFKTTNAGLNWVLKFSELSGGISYLSALSGADANTICAAWMDGSCVRSSDGGTSWTVIPGCFSPGQEVKGISFLNSTTGFATGSSGLFYRTTNAGLNWISLPTPQSDWSYNQVKIVSGTEIYLVGDPSYLYKTTNLGDTWTSLPITPVSGVAGSFVWYSMDHYGSTYVLSGDYGQIAKSTDGCATWSVPGYFQLSTALMFDITTVPGTSKLWTVGRAFGSATTKEIMYSSNSGTNWTTYNLGVSGDFFSISMINENTGYVSGQNNQVMKTTDGGVSWFLKTGPSATATAQLYQCDFIDENTGWVFVNFSPQPAGGSIYKTTNGGDNWTQQTTGAASEQIYSADMVDANTGFCVMNQSGRPIYRTTNGGVNWTGATITGFTGSIHGVTSPDGINVFACQSGGTSRVAKSSNGGVNWTLITLPVAIDYTSIDFKDANTGYVSGNLTAGISRTTNGGLNWTYQNTHSITLVKVFVTPGDTAYALGGNTGIYRYAGVSSQVSLNLTLSMQAMYNSGTNKLVRKDTVKVYLRNASSPYAIVDSASGTIDTVSLTGQFTFPNAASGSYYIVVKHFNSMETWSRTGGETMISGTPYNYDFTTAGSKAYGSNQIQVGTEWSTYSGDVNQDGIIDLNDIILIFNDVTNFVGGSYVDTDLNADNLVTLADLLIAYNNSANFVILSRP